MKRPILVLQYPDSREARTVALAATRNLEALHAFKEAVLNESRLTVVDRQYDEVLSVQNQTELERLSRLLGLLIPESYNGEE